MILKEITFQGVGPFTDTTTLSVEPNVTVLTGRNDVGKSFVLRTLEKIYHNNAIDEKDVNIVHHSEGNWRENAELKCELIFQATRDFDVQDQGRRREIKKSNLLTITNVLSPERHGAVLHQINGANVGRYKFQGFPNVVAVFQDNSINSTISLSAPNSTEKAFLEQLFGRDVEVQFKDLDIALRTARIKNAEQEINQRLRQILPSSLEYSIGLSVVPSDDDYKLIITLVDAINGNTPFDYRGAGMQRLINILIPLTQVRNGNSPTLLLLDEPENSLHADAQHQLRKFLEQLASDDMTQVVYATHSPAMINPMLPQSIRLLEQVPYQINGLNYPTTRIKNVAPYDTYVRHHLGVLPADSLQYSPIVVITEGATDSVGIPYLLNRLAQNGVQGFDDVMNMGGLVVFRDGGGDSYDHLCGLVLAQGCKPIIFLDGDKKQQIDKINRKYPEVPVICLNQTEIEELIPEATYFEALQLEYNNPMLNQDSFVEWLDSCEDDAWAKNAPLSKKIEQWLSKNHNEVVYNKPIVFRRAVDNTDVTLIDTLCLVQLIDQIKTELDRL